ncbi:MAG: hypothetical protein PWP23_840 [Candidatus Sumerlaeota bacterium]|nr:hypothetical protein [Candidatus Sumerlaeota bacterium]
MFPAVDPIPLPAPVWLFRVLHVTTLALHFLSLHLLVGGLLMASIWTLMARGGRNAPMRDAAGAVANRLPIIMTFVINLGVPPLLFTQVLYGRALYTSSVLIGAWWIAVIGLLMAAYTLLYVANARSTRGKGWGWIGLVALLLIFKIAFIYSSNMTLMLRPEVWPAMYQDNPSGVQFNSGDPTVMPRLIFMLAGSLAVGGVGMMFLGLKKFLAAETTLFLRRWGARLAAIGIVAQAGAGFWVMSTQPEAVREGLAASSVYSGCLIAWGATAVLLLGVGVVAQLKASAPGWLMPSVAGLLAFVNVAAMTLFRDGIREVTLGLHGFDVWDRAVATNWIVVGVFLVLFVAGLGVIFWLGSVVARAKGVEERYA